MIHAGRLRLAALLLVVALTGIGCTSTSLYDWGDYELALYHFYDDPESYDEYVAALEAIVNDSDSADRVPPGMYAEYGYVLQAGGRTEEALVYFRREKEKWPESALFMDMMIGNLNDRSVPSAEQPGAAAGTEEAE